MSQSLLQARENLEWMCRSAWNMADLILPRGTVSRAPLGLERHGGLPEALAFRRISQSIVWGKQPARPVMRPNRNFPIWRS